MKRKGYVHIYTGDGKGKTTAAMGLAMRALGNNHTVDVVQFLKGQVTGELNFKHPNFTLTQFGTKHFITSTPSKLDLDLGQNALQYISNLLSNKKPDVLILDEIIDAMSYNIISESDILNIINNKPSHTELILTGHTITPNLLNKSDLVTEMKKIKHYYDKGILARQGIEY